MTNDDEQWGPSKGLVRTQSVNIDLALASEVFDHFCSQANTLKSILRTFSYLCEILRLKPTEFPYFYPKIKSKLKTWKAQALWAKFDKRASHKIYNRGKACSGQRMLVIGAGPCGLRTAIEAQLLGAKVVVIEKRDRFSRNNVLHLWPYNIQDLRGLGAKKFYGKFCAGAIDHISIRQLQCILLKVCLCLGVEIYESVGFEGLVEPTDVETGWRAEVSPPGHPVGQYEFDVLIGADGKRNTLHGFKRKEFRGKLAIAVTANFIRRHDEAESQVEEISGVAFIFNQKFFNDLNEAKGIDLENIVYYKDETHYFVMTAKKQSLLEKGVIIVNDPDTAKLLSPENIRAEKLFEYAREAADFATNYQLPHMDFAVNHYGKPDVAMFDFTSMFQAENSCRVKERHGHRLLISLVGDSLLEPFWPTGTGCARGFFGGLDACWLMRQFALGKLTTLEAIAERESIYRILPQTTPENTCKDYSSYTAEPQTRYPTLNTKLVLPFQVTHLVDTDNPSQLEEELRQSNSSSEPLKRRRKESHVSPDNLQKWLAKQVEAYEDVILSDMTTSFQSGLALCAIIHRYRPDLIDYNQLDKKDPLENIQLAFDIMEHELGISPAIPAGELGDIRRIPDKLTMMSYLSQVYECFRKDIPAVNRMSVVGEDEEDLLDAEYRTQQINRPLARRGKHLENGNRISIGQLVASEAASKKVSKKRRSKESVDMLDEDDDDKKMLPVNEGSAISNKENVLETARLNRSAHRKRLLRLMERAEVSSSDRKLSDKSKNERKSIKEEERYKVIEAQFSAKRRSGGSGDIASKYRENKRPKDLKRAIGKLDKDDWNIKNIEEKLIIKKDPEAGHRDKVPKWSKAAFQDKFNIMKGKLENGEEIPQGSKKYADIDSSLARLQKKLREGNALETGQRGSNRVSALAGELFEIKKMEEMELGVAIAETKHFTATDCLPVPSRLRPSGGGGSEICHFCAKRVYVVERMSAESKFFHRSCFRCDYCNVLLRLGSYVYHREGQFAGKFFCIPHSTENSLEKYRYRRKADEIRDAEQRQRELIHRPTNDWRASTSAPTSYFDSLTAAHKERLVSSLDANMRGTTPERAEFEASVDSHSEEETPSIMDEDEWTDRNFGNSLLIEEEENENTSEDSVSDLDSDAGDSDDERKAEDGKLLTSKETRQLQKEWMKRYNPARGKEQNSDEEVSQYDNVKKERETSDEEECEGECEDAHEADYEDDDDDSESESESTDSDSGNAVARKPLTVPAVVPARRRSRQKQAKASTQESEDETSTEVDSDEETTSTDDDDSSSESSVVESEFSSGTNTECEFTDSEGRPNPFHKELEVPKIVIEPGSPLTSARRKAAAAAAAVEPNKNYFPAKNSFPSQKYIEQKIGLETRERSEPSLSSLTYASRLQYKTPNLSGRLQSEEVRQAGYVTRSTQRALSLKKNWVSDAPANMATGKKTDAAEIDSRLKSLMERLSNQQSLLRPADKPSSQMEHLLKNSPSSRVILSQSTSSLRDPARFKSPPPSSQGGGITAGTGMTSYHCYPSHYPSLSTTATASTFTTNTIATVVTAVTIAPKAIIPPVIEEVIEAVKPEEAPASFLDIEQITVPIQPVADVQVQPSSCNSSSEETSTESSSESTQSENLSPPPPPIPPAPFMVPDILIHSDNDLQNRSNKIVEKPIVIETVISELKSPLSRNLSNCSGKDEFESCVEELEETENKSSDLNYHTPGKEMEAKEIVKEEILSPPFETSVPLATSSPLTQTPEKEQVVVKLTDDEVTRIYRERNPLERLAQLNSLKQRESSVVRDMIMARVGAGSRTSASSTRPAFGVRRPRNSILTSTVPLPPKEDYMTALTPLPPVLNSLELENNFHIKSQSCHQLEQLMDFPLIDADEDEMSPTPTPPVRPARRNARSPKRTETLQPGVELKSEKSEIISKEAPKLTNGHDTSNGNKENENDMSPKQTAVKKTVSLPATPLTDPEKFGIPVRNTTKHSHNKNQSARKKLTLGINNTSRSSDENNSLASPGDQISSTSNEIDNMDGIVSSDSSSMPNSPAKRSTGSMSQTREPKKTFIQAITGMFGRGTTPDSRAKSPDSKTSENERKSRSDSFMKFAKGFRSPNISQKSSPSSPEAPRADISELSMSSHTSYPNTPRRTNENVQHQNEQNLIFQTISIQASHPSTPPFPLSRKITLKQAHSEESLSDEVEDGEGSPETSLAFVANNIKTNSGDGILPKSSLPPEILEKILRRGGKSGKRASKIAQLKRVRKAQEIQRQLEELDVRHKDLEERGVKAEQSLRGETNEAENLNEGELMQTWFLLLAEKNALVRSEQELLVQAKQLELEDLSARLEVELRDHLLRDYRSPDSVSREGEILDELLEISEQREMLQSMLLRDKMRYQLEDKDIEAQMRAKGIRITPIRKITAN